jgi:hypothetical protein
VVASGIMTYAAGGIWSDNKPSGVRLRHCVEGRSTRFGFSLIGNTSITYTFLLERSVISSNDHAADRRNQVSCMFVGHGEGHDQ